MDIADLTRTVRTKIHPCTCGCWVWTGSLDTQGYAQVKMHGRLTLVHRYVYAKAFGDLDPELTIDHLCDRHRGCVNPAHFEQVSRSENSVRANKRRWYPTSDTSGCDYPKKDQP